MQPMQQRELTDRDIAIIKGMVDRGDKQMHIGVLYGINQGRVCEIKKGRLPRYKLVPAASPDELPAPGPYVVVSERVFDRAVSQAQSYQMMVTELLTLAAKYEALAQTPNGDSYEHGTRQAIQTLHRQ